MKKRTGFTLVELLAVIVILAIVLIIAVPGVLSIINKTKEDAFASQKKILAESARLYVSTETDIKWTGKDTKVAVVTLEQMKQSGHLDQKIINPRNKKEITCGSVVVSKDAPNKTSYDVHLGCANSPRLSSNMIPIVYNGNTWVKADPNNTDQSWFQYETQQWANVATVSESTREAYTNAKIGNEVKMEDINAMFVWVPRFKYKLFNVDGTISPVGNKDLAGEYHIDVEFETTTDQKSNGSKNGRWLTYPAFTFGGEELEGFWMAKFETGYKDATTTTEAQSNTVDPTKVIVKPSVYSWRSILAVNMFKNAQGMKDASNPYGFTVNENPHLAKNMEWGAMAYLTQSKYGKQGNAMYMGSEKEVRINNNNIYLTGCGADAQDAVGVETCNSYTTVNGMTASTTGNISGVYDTAGGAWDYVAGVMKDENGSDLYVSLSGFDQAELNQIGAEGKYLDVYEYGTTWEDRSRGYLGDATIEMGPFDNYQNAWYKDYGRFIYKNVSWFYRGAFPNDISFAGITAYRYSNHGEKTHGTSRIVVV